MMWTTRQRSEGAGALNYFEQGSGPPLVLIHGVGLRAEAWCGMLPVLALNHRVICVDLPGHGASPLNAADTLDGFVERCAAFIQALDQPVCVVGHSMAALLAIELAARMPEQIRAIAGLNTVYRRSAKAAAAVLARASSLAEGESSDPTPTLDRWFGPAPIGANEDAAEACRTWLTGSGTSGYAVAYRIFAESDGPSSKALGQLDCPAFFVTGALDSNSTPAMSHALAERCNGHWEAVETAAHMMPMTHAHSVSELLVQHFGPAGVSKSRMPD